MPETKICRSRKFMRQSTLDKPVVPKVTADRCPPLPKNLTKTSRILALLQRPSGASLEELIEVTCWLPHTIRAALTGLRKKGHPVTSEKIDGIRRYRIVVGD